MVAPQSSRVMILGAEPRVHVMLDLYGLHASPDIVIVDRHPHRREHPLLGYEVRDLATIDPSGIAHVVIGEPPINFTYDDAFAALEAVGIPRAMCATIYEPGRVDSILGPRSPLDVAGRMALGYRAVYHDVFERAGYGYGMMLAAEEARRMGLTRIAALEFGVWRGAGLKNLCEIAQFLRQTQGIEFEIYGFDTGKGLPEMKDYRDHPDLWAQGTMAMPDFGKLAKELPSDCHLIIGDVAETVSQFLRDHASIDTPVAFVSLDVDLYSSSVSALKIFDAEAERLLPAVPLWVDDSYINVMQNSFCGEALAIKEFNDSHPMRKIDQKIVRGDHPPRLWHHCYYFAHIFDHPVRMGLKPALFDGFFHTIY